MELQPLPPMLSYPSPQGYNRDVGHLRLISIFHYVYGGLIALGSSIFLIHLALGIWFLTNPPTPTNGPPPPPEVGWLFIVFGALFPLIGWTLGGLVIYSGRCIARRRNWTFSLVVAGLMCVSGVLGIVLAVFTFLVLLRPTVKLAYGLPP